MYAIFWPSGEIFGRMEIEPCWVTCVTLPAAEHDFRGRDTRDSGHLAHDFVRDLMRQQPRPLRLCAQTLPDDLRSFGNVVQPRF
jgi:hypothetical protein